jgi:hypothetical protein
MKKILLGLLLTGSMLSFSNISDEQNVISYSRTVKANYKLQDYVQNRTENKSINISNLNTIKLDIETERYNGEVVFTLVDSKGKVLITLNSPREFERYINLNFNEKYVLNINLNNFTGEYEIEIKGK